MFGLGGCEWCYLTSPIFHFADFLRDEDIKFAQAQLNKNQNKISLVQKQINPVKFYLKKEDKAEEGGLYDSDERQEAESDQEDPDDFGYDLAGGVKVRQIDEEFKNPQDDDDDDEEVNPNDIQLQIKKEDKLNEDID